MAAHVVSIRMVPGKEPGPVGSPQLKAKVKDTVRFESSDGTLNINIVDPFGVIRKVAANVNHTLEQRGTFRYQCGITKGGTTFGWPDDPDTEAGGEIIVERRG